MKETIAGTILILIVVAISLYLGRDIEPDLSSDGGYEPCQTSGHPLWTDC